MKKVIEFSVKSPLLVNLLSIFMVLSGLMALFQIQREAFPNVNYDVVTVETSYFGAPPEEIEKLITIDLEEELQEVTGIDEMVSVSAENISMIVLQIDPDEKDKDKIVNDIQRAVDRVRDLPEDAEDPEVNEIQSKDMPIINVSLSGDIPEKELQDLARQLEVELLDLDDVARIDRMGWRDSEIWVEVDPEKVGDDYIPLEEIIQALSNQNLNLPGGNLNTSRGEFLVRTMGEFETPEEIEKVIIRSNDRGKSIRIKDIAEVKAAFKDDDLVEKTNGHQAINLTVVKKERGDIIRLVDEVKVVADAFGDEHAGQIEIAYFDDFSFYVKRRLNVLKNNGLVGIFFVMIALLIFLSPISAIMTAIGIPIAVLSAVFFMLCLGVTINLISMFAMIMVLGLVVDDAIVIAENVFRYVEEGLPVRQAAIKGASEVAAPVILTVLTTIVAFIPIFFMKGIMGKFVFVIPIIVIITLIASLIECLLILPSHLAESVRPGHKEKEKNYAWFRWLQKVYLGVLKWVVKFRYLALILFMIGFVFVMILRATSVPFRLFPQGLIEEFFVKVEAPIGTSLKDMSKRVEKIEKIISQMPEGEVENYVTQVGLIRESSDDPYTDRGSHLGQIHVFLTPEKETTRRHADLIIEEMRGKTSEFSEDVFKEISYEKVKAGPPVGKPVSLRLRGDSLQELSEVAKKFREFLGTIDGVKDIKDDFDKGKYEFRVDVDEEYARKAGLTIRGIATSVRYAIEGGVATTIKKTDEEVDVIVRYPEELRVDKKIFDEVYIPNPNGKLIPLEKVAKISESTGLNAIRHLDRKRLVNVTAELDEDKITALDVEGRVTEFYESKISKEHPNIILSFGGEQKETAESLESLKRAILLAVLLIFILLASFFNSIVLALLVMVAIPFGAMGVIIAFFFHGQPLSFMALLGCVGLAGVVVNDSIVLVSFIQRHVKQGMDTMSAVVEAGRLRLRPVLLTSITTVVGLMPVAYGIGGSDPFLKPMALAIGWGLVFATVLTLLFIPCLFVIANDFSNIWKAILRFFKPSSDFNS